MPVELPPEAARQAHASLRRFCEQELELELGDLQVTMLLKFVLAEVAPSAYNAGVAAAEAYLRDRLGDMEGAVHETEFAYWPKGTSVRRK